MRIPLVANDDSARVIEAPSGPSAERRWTALDGLRGLAALSVFASHFVGALPESPAINRLQLSCGRVFWDGAAAVDLFFVLSGFVLASPYLGDRPKSLSYGDFALRRIFRIYPAYWVALILAIGLRALSGATNNSLDGLSLWIGSLWKDSISSTEVVNHFALAGPRFNSHLFDPVVWSLVVEMRLSLLVPLLIVLHKKLSPALRCLGLAGILIAGWWTGRVAFLPLFYVGVWLAKDHAALAAPLKHLCRTPLMISALVLSSLILYGNRWMGWQWFDQSERIQLLQHWLSGGGALLAIALLVAGPRMLRTPFQSKPCTFLGQISYGFYLFHLPLLLTVAGLLWPRFHSIGAILVVSLGSSIVLSALVWRFIEAPCQQLGRRAWPTIRRQIWA